MGNWQGVQESLARGIQIGAATGGGRLSQIGYLLKSVADRLKTQRETAEAAQQKLLGTVGEYQLKSMFEPETRLKEKLYSKVFGEEEPITETPVPTGKVSLMGGYKPKGFELGGITFERELTPEEQEIKIKEKVQEATAIEKGKEIEKANIKRKIYGKDLNNFLSIDNVLHQARGTGKERFGAGAKMSWQGITRETPLGQAVATHDAAAKRLRVQLVRAAGDVGNINIVEQKAAEKLIPTKWDDFRTAELKRAYLSELSRAIEDNDGNMIKEVLEKAGIGYTEGNQQMQPQEFSEADIEYTMQKYNLSREEILRRLGK